MKKHILVILGHPSLDSFCRALADSYIKGAKESGHEIKTLLLGDLTFSHDMKGYKTMPPLEPDLKTAQELITWADHLVFVYPIWWSGPPALLQSFIERTFLPGFAFKFHKNPHRIDWEKFLTGKSARLLTTMDAPPVYYKWFIGDPASKIMKIGILNFCGVKPVKQNYFGSVKTSTEAQREKWLRTCYALGLKE